MYDVIVVGAGPVGSYTAYQLADSGFETVLLEEDEEVGREVICTGVIGREAFERFDLPRQTIISSIKSINFLSPSLLAISYVPSQVLAYVVDRNPFDKRILEQARQRGAVVWLGRKVQKVRIEENFAEVQFSHNHSPENMRAKAVVLATGVNYQLQSKLGLGSPPAFLQGAQTQTEVENLLETEIYLGRDISPGSFAWAVPLKGSRARLGVLTRAKGIFYLKRFLQQRLQGKLKEKEPRMVQKRIAHGPIPRSIKDRLLVVGEAAGQVKTTTGGGIFYGLLCSEMAAQVLKKALFKGDLSQRGLAEYERLWRSKLGRELKMGCLAHKTLEKLGDRHLDLIFKLLRERKELKSLIQSKVHFDYYSPLISLVLKLLPGFIS